MSTLAVKAPLSSQAPTATKGNRIDWIERAWFLSVAVYAAALPLWFFAPTGLAIGNWKSVLIVDALFAASVLLGLLRMALSRQWRLKPAVLIDALWLMLAIVLPVICSPDPRAGLPDIFRFGYSAVLYVMVAHLRLDANRLRLLAWLWAGAAVIITCRSLQALAIYQISDVRSPLLSFLGGAAYQGNLAVRLQGTFANPNTFAPFLNTALVFALILTREYKNRSFAWFLTIASAAIIFAGGLLTSSRGTAGLILTLGLVAVWWSAASRWRGLMRIVSIAAMTCSVLAVLITSIWWIYPVKRVSNTDNRVQLQINTDHAPYYLYHAGALRMFRAHPLTGIGPGRFEGQFRNYVSWEEVLPSFRWFAETEEGVRGRYASGSDPHSTWFGWLARGGLMTMACLLIFAARAGGRIAKRPDAVAQAALAGLVGVAFAGLYVEILHMRFIWLMLAVATAWVTTQRADTRLGGNA